MFKTGRFGVMLIQQTV